MPDPSGNYETTKRVPVVLTFEDHKLVGLEVSRAGFIEVVQARLDDEPRTPLLVTIEKIDPASLPRGAMGEVFGVPVWLTPSKSRAERSARARRVGPPS